ncbi:MAG: hypothetical protein CFH08_01067 [Alphaproteobacteria bacterium MarineAlpha3_Bin7]|nr:MAG: hypothetical protein CFH08_01067 [Alphaproteobacteria bacterium MarineAlpha3_Bin7]
MAGATNRADFSNNLGSRSFGLIFSALLAFIFFILFLVFDLLLPLLGLFSVLFLLVSLIIPRILLPLAALWTKLLRIVGYFNNHLILGILFFAIFVPLGLVMRIFGRKIINKNFSANQLSYFSSVKRQTDKQTIKDIF